MLSVSNLSASYSGIVALDNVSLEVRQGELVSLIGANGAGKSTLLNCISGIVPANGGSIVFRGAEMTGRRPARIARAGLLHVPEGRQMLNDLTVEDNLLLGRLALADRNPSWTEKQIVDLFPVLGRRRQQRAGSLSGGEQQMLAIGRALMGAPELLLLDEPSLGLAPLIVAHVFEVLARLSAGGLTILLVEQNARRALAVASRAYVLERGRVARSATAQALRDDPEIASYYLGNLAPAPAGAQL